MSLQTDGVWKGAVWAATVWGQDVWFEGAVAPPSPPSGSGVGGGGAYYPHRAPHRWPGTKSRKKLRDELVDLVGEIAEASPDAQDAAVSALKPVIGPVEMFNTTLLEQRIENAILAAQTRVEIAAIRARLRMLEDILDDDDVEMLILH